jgi:hypothetical protein
MKPTTVNAKATGTGHGYVPNTAKKTKTTASFGNTMKPTTVNTTPTHTPHGYTPTANTSHTPAATGSDSSSAFKVKVRVKQKNQSSEPTPSTEPKPVPAPTKPKQTKVVASTNTNAHADEVQSRINKHQSVLKDPNATDDAKKAARAGLVQAASDAANMQADSRKNTRRTRVAEDAPTNNAGAGQVAGIGIDNPNGPKHQGEPGVVRKKRLRDIIDMKFLKEKD